MKDQPITDHRKTSGKSSQTGKGRIEKTGSITIWLPNKSISVRM